MMEAVATGRSPGSPMMATKGSRVRPELLNPLFQPIGRLPSVGPKLERKLTQLLLGADAPAPATIRDLLFHMPSGVIDRRRQPGIALSPEGAIVTLKVRVDRHRPAPRGRSRAPYRVFCHDETGEIALVFFHVKRNWIERVLPVGETRYVSGRVEWFNGRPQMVHPDHMVDEAGFADLPMIEPVYPLTEGVSGRVVGRAIAAALERVPALAEWQDAAWLSGRDWTDFAASLQSLHQPKRPDDLVPTGAPWLRLAYDEFLANQLALALVRANMKRLSGHARIFDGSLKAKIVASLPFSLTGSQLQAIADIERDLADLHRSSFTRIHGIDIEINTFDQEAACEKV